MTAATTATATTGRHRHRASYTPRRVELLPPKRRRAAWPRLLAAAVGMCAITYAIGGLTARPPAPSPSPILMCDRLGSGGRCETPDSAFGAAVGMLGCRPSGEQR